MAVMNMGPAAESTSIMLHSHGDWWQKIEHHERWQGDDNAFGRERRRFYRPYHVCYSLSPQRESTANAQVATRSFIHQTGAR